MPTRDESSSRSASGQSVTDTSESTVESDEQSVALRKVPVLAIVLEADRPEAGAAVFSLDGCRWVEIHRGKERRSERKDDGLVVFVPDKRMSRPHVRIALGRDCTLTDLGSSNGTFVESGGGEDRVNASALPPGRLFRVGHTFATIVADGAALFDRGRAHAPWPFMTLYSPFARELVRLERVAASTLPILLLGETGSGKEVVASAIHERSARPGKLVAVNCGAIPPNLVEAHLFGHQKGSFSGALRDELGYVRSAQYGTLFLDEIGDLPLLAQAALLRVLQESEITPVGAFQPTKVDVRFVSATHKDLSVAVARGDFRADLFARLAGFTFSVPPLRERVFDVGAILAELRARGGQPYTLRPDAAWMLLGHDYPMNVRELRHAIESATVLSENASIAAENLPAAMREVERPSLDEDDAALKEDLERRLLEHGGNISQVAREMGKARQQVQRWVKRFGLKS